MAEEDLNRFWAGMPLAENSMYVGKACGWCGVELEAGDWCAPFSTGEGALVLCEDCASYGGHPKDEPAWLR